MNLFRNGGMLMWTWHFSDTNECEVENKCDHVCRNTEGDYECKCERLYHLEGKSTCKANSEYLNFNTQLV